MVLISKLITIIDLVLAPSHIISRGPKETLGKLLKIVKMVQIFFLKLETNRIKPQ